MIFHNNCYCHKLFNVLNCYIFQGNIFFPLPDGTGLMYNVSGSADPPKPNGKINREVPCKTMYMEMLPVHNWLKKPQRFVTVCVLLCVCVSVHVCSFVLMCDIDAYVQCAYAHLHIDINCHVFTRAHACLHVCYCECLTVVMSFVFLFYQEFSIKEKGISSSVKRLNIAM